MKHKFTVPSFGTWDEDQTFTLTEEELAEIVHVCSAVSNGEYAGMDPKVHKALTRKGVLSRIDGTTSFTSWSIYYQHTNQANRWDYRQRKQKQLVRLAKRLNLDPFMRVSGDARFTLLDVMWFRQDERDLYIIKNASRRLMSRISARAARLFGES